MSKRNDLKILLMCLTLSISTFCININAMEAKPNENLNNYKIKKDFTINNNNNKLNLCNLNIKPIKKCIPEKYSVLKPTKQQTQKYSENNTKGKKKDIIRPKSEDNLIFKDDKRPKLDKRANESNKNKTPNKTEFLPPIKLLLKYFDEFHHEKMDRIIKDPNTSNDQVKKMAINYKLLMLPSYKTLEDSLIKCDHCIKTINKLYEKFLELTTNYDPAVNNIIEIRTIYVAMVNYVMHLREAITAAEKAKLNKDKCKELVNEFFKLHDEKIKKIKEYLEKLDPTYKNIFPYCKTESMYKKVHKIKKTEENPKNTPLNKVAYSIIDGAYDELHIKNRTPNKKMNSISNVYNIKTNSISENSENKISNETAYSSKYINNLNIKNKTPNKTIKSIFSFYTPYYAINHVLDDMYKVNIINRLKNKDTTDEQALKIINDKNLIRKILKTDGLNKKELVAYRVNYIFKAVPKYWNECVNTYKNLCTKDNDENLKEYENYKIILRTAFALIVHFNNHLIDIKKKKISLLKEISELPNNSKFLEQLEGFITKNNKNINILKKELQRVLKKIEELKKNKIDQKTSNNK